MEGDTFNPCAPVDVVQNKVADTVTGDAVVQSAGDPVSQQAAVAPSLVVLMFLHRSPQLILGRRKPWNEIMLVNRWLIF